MPENGSTKKIKLDSDFNRPKQPSNSLAYRVDNRIIAYKVMPFLSTKEAFLLSRTWHDISKCPNTELNKRALIKLQRALLDDDQKIMTAILEHSPPERLHYLFKTNPADIGVPIIESNTPGKSTWQRFLSKPIINMAVNLRRVEALALIAPVLYEHEELKQERAKCVLPQYSSAEQKAMQDFYIEKYCLPFIVTLAADTTIKVPWKMNPETKQEEANILTPSETTKVAIDNLRNKLLPEQAIDLDKLDTPKLQDADGSYVDMEQFCMAAVRAYNEHFHMFQNWDQRAAYSIALEGLIFTLLGPEDGKKFCAGLYNWVNGTDVFLMATPQDKNYKVSDKNNLYLYQDKGRVVYYVPDHEQPQLLAELKLPEAAKFTATPKKLTQCIDEKLITEVLNTTSKREHTFDQGRILSGAACALTLKDGRSFMRCTRDFNSGQGVNFLVGIFAAAICGFARGTGWCRRGLENYFKQKRQCLESLRNACEITQNGLPTLRK